MKKYTELVICGNGTPKRELVYVDDVADACVYFMNKRVKNTIINIGTGKDLSIKAYAQLLLKIIYPKNKIKIKFDKTKPNGTPRKVLDINLAKSYGWKARTDIKKAIQITYEDFLTKTPRKMSS